MTRGGVCLFQGKEMESKMRSHAEYPLVKEKAGMALTQPGH